MPHRARTPGYQTGSQAGLVRHSHGCASPWTDLHGLGYILLELFLSSAAAQDAPDADTARTTELQSLKRLVEDICAPPR